MPDPTIPQVIGKATQGLMVEYIKKAINRSNTMYNLRERFSLIDKKYAREIDREIENQRAKRANDSGAASKIQNITVPVIVQAVEAAVTYQTSVFLTGHPIFASVAPPAFVKEGKVLDSIIERDQIQFGWVRELQMSFRDGFKYNFLATELDWVTFKTQSFSTDLTAGPNAKIEEIVRAGNRWKRLDPYNVFFDTSVAPARVHEDGEYAGYTEMMSRTKLKRFLDDLPTGMRFKEAFESGNRGTGDNNQSDAYFVPEINSRVFIDSTLDKGFDWVSWVSANTKEEGKIRYSPGYEVTTIYAWIIPSEFGLSIPGSNTPQIFKMIMVNQSIVVYCEKVTNAHGYLPILIGQPYEDGFGLQTKSLAETVEEFQDVTTALLVGMLASRRRAVSDRMIYDASKINAEDINSPNPAAKIPVRNSAFGSDIRTAVYQIPFEDSQAGVAISETQLLLGLANETTGQNKVRQGQFVKGNKTQSEFDTVMANANGRDQTIALLLQDQLFRPAKEIIKTNILQYQGVEDIFSPSQREQYQVDPTELRKMVMSFKISDGLLPTDKIMSAESWGIALQTIMSNPQINSSYNVGPMFSYLMEQRGAEVSAFEKSPEQVAYEQALRSWEAAMAALQGVEGITQEMIPAQPLPEQFGYNPAEQGTTAGMQGIEVTQRVTNATNNITNNINGAPTRS